MFKISLTRFLGKKDKKGKKGKKDKDPTSNRSIEDLWEELVKMEIIIPTKDIHLKDFIGDYSFLGWFSSVEKFWKKNVGIILKTLLSLRKFENKSN